MRPRRKKQEPINDEAPYAPRGNDGIDVVPQGESDTINATSTSGELVVAGPVAEPTPDCIGEFPELTPERVLALTIYAQGDLSVAKSQVTDGPALKITAQDMGPTYRLTASVDHDATG